MTQRLGPVRNDALAPTGSYVYGRIFQDSTGKVRDIVHATWDTFVDADIADYATARLTEKGTASLTFQGDEPTDLDYIREGFTVHYFVRAGGSPALSDVYIGSQRIGDEGLAAMLAGGTFGAIVADGSNTTGTFKTDLSESSDDYFKQATITFYSGTNAGQTRQIAATSGYNGTTKFITLASGQAFDAAFSAGDKFFILGRIN